MVRTITKFRLTEESLDLPFESARSSRKFVEQTRTCRWYLPNCWQMFHPWWTSGSKGFLKISFWLVRGTINGGNPMWLLQGRMITCCNLVVLS